MPSYVLSSKRITLEFKDRTKAYVDPTSLVVVIVEPPDAANTTLNESLTASDTTITLTSVAGFPSSGEVLIESELIRYTGVSGNDLTGCTRGMGGTTAATHSLGVEAHEVAASIRPAAGPDQTSPFALKRDAVGKFHALYKPVRSGRHYYRAAGLFTDSTLDTAIEGELDVAHSEVLNV